MKSKNDILKEYDDATNDERDAVFQRLVLEILLVVMDRLAVIRDRLGRLEAQ